MPSSHEAAMHLLGCPCGLGDEKLSPIDYLTRCVRVRFDSANLAAGLGRTFSAKIPIVTENLSEDIQNKLGNDDLLESLNGLVREPLMCIYKYPVGDGHIDGVPTGQRRRSAFYSLRFNHPYNLQANHGSEVRRLRRVFEAIDNNTFRKSDIYFAHWSGETENCPCDNKALYQSHWSEDGEGYALLAAMDISENNGMLELRFGQTQRNEDSSYKRDFTITNDCQFNPASPSLWVQSSMCFESGVYEKYIDLDTLNPTPIRLTFGKKFCLVIPDGDMWDAISDILPPKSDPEEMRCWGENSFIEREFNGNRYVIIHTAFYNTTAVRVLNDIRRRLERPSNFSINGGLSVDVFGTNREWLGNTESNNEIIVPNDHLGVKLLLTKRRGEILERLYVLRCRIFSNEQIYVDFSSQDLEEADAREIDGGFEFIINPRNREALTLNLMRLPSSSFHLDFQELEMTESLRKLTHVSLAIRRENA